jgi:ParB-like chromosome segregation protein Spo0J
MIDQQPISSVKWKNIKELKPNSYNPNHVAPDELDLLIVSILESGWTQPIVIDENNVIIDGFHRYTVSNKKEIFNIFQGMVPCVVSKNKTESDCMMSTIRHNRARGTHSVLKMSEILSSMIDKGVGKTEILKKLKMSEEEVARLLFSEGVPFSSVLDGDFSFAWEPDVK